MKRLLLIWVTILSFSGAGQAATQIINIPLYEGTIPGAISADNPGIVKDERNNDKFIIAISKPSLTLYLPDNKENIDKSVIISPGGGYYGVSSIKEGTEVAERFANHGVAAFVLHYRMPNPETMDTPHAGPLQDLQQALYVARLRSKEWGIDPDGIGVMGFSAGGHLAATAATHFAQPVLPTLSSQDVTPDFQVLIYPVVSMQPGVTHQGSRELLLGKAPSAALVANYSNEQQVTAETPAAYIVHANDDDAVVVENALNYYHALRAQDVAVQMLLLNRGGHGFGMRHHVDWFPGVLEWIKTR